MTLRRFHPLGAALAALLILPALADAQVVRSAIGGVEVNPQGVLSTPAVTTVRSAAEVVRRNMQRVPDNLADVTEFRLISRPQKQDAKSRTQFGISAACSASNTCLSIPIRTTSYSVDLPKRGRSTTWEMS